MKPGQRTFDHPSRTTEPTAVGRAALRELTVDPAALQGIAMRLRVVAPIALNQVWLVDRTTGTAAQWRDRVDQRQQLGDVVAVGGGQQRRQRNAARFGENVVLRPRLTAIGWVRSSFFPPRSARTEALSTSARVRSNWPRWRNSASRTACNRRQTPARCHRTIVASRYCPSHTPFLSGAFATAARSAIRTGCRSTRPDRAREAGPWSSSGVVAAAGGAARFGSTGHRR